MPLVPFQTEPAPLTAPVLSAAEIASHPMAPPSSPQILNQKRVSCAPALRLNMDLVPTGVRIKHPNPPASVRLWNRFSFTLGSPRTGLRPWGGYSRDPQDAVFASWGGWAGHVAGVVKLVFPLGSTRFSATRVSIFFP